jgi:actin-like ATPase involved in cell morphogenesis
VSDVPNTDLSSATSTEGPSWAIGIDFGTSRTAAAVATLDRVTPLELGTNRWIPSSVLLQPNGELMVGVAAEQLAGANPDRLDRTPKQALGGSAHLLLGGTAVDPRDACAAVLRSVLSEGIRQMGTVPAVAVLTHPVRWGQVRRDALRSAAERAGLQRCYLVEEPVAAAVHYAAHQVSPGGIAAVYDLGGGTFDTAVLRRVDEGFEVIGKPGGSEHIGGEGFDHALFRWFGEQLTSSRPALWEQLMQSSERRWIHAALDLLADARTAKETLSSYTSTQLFISDADRDFVVHRSEFEALIAPDIERTMDLLDETIDDADLRVDDLEAVFLVGGSSRIPLVMRLANQRYGSRVVTRDEPKGVVSLGAAKLAARLLVPTPTPAPTPTPTQPPTANPPTAIAPTAMSPTQETSATSTLGAVTSQATEKATAAIVSLRSRFPASPSPSGKRMFVPKAAQTSVTSAWEIELGTPITALHGTTRQIVVVAGTVARAVDAATGTLVWSQHVPSRVVARPMFIDDTVIVVTTDGRSGGLDVASGAVKWGAGEPGPLVVGAGVTADTSGATLVIANHQGLVNGLDPRSGLVRWRQPMGGEVRADIAVAHGRVIVSRYDGYVVAFDTASGAVLWEQRVGGTVGFAPIVAGERLFLPTETGQIAVIATLTGQIEGWLSLGGRPMCALAASNNQLGAVDATGRLNVFATDSGTLLANHVITKPSGTLSMRGIALSNESPNTAIVDLGHELRVINLTNGQAGFSWPTNTGTSACPFVVGRRFISPSTFSRLGAFDLTASLG